MSKSYRKIASAVKTLEVLDIIAGSIKPVGSQVIAEALDMKYDTVMCHIATLISAGYIEKQGDGYAATLKLATFYAKKKAQLESSREQVEKELKNIGA